MTRTKTARRRDVEQNKSKGLGFKPPADNGMPYEILDGILKEMGVVIHYEKEYQGSEWGWTIRKKVEGVREIRWFDSKPDAYAYALRSKIFPKEDK